MKIEDQILNSLDSLIAQYKEELTFLQNRSMDTFDMTTLPQIIQDIAKLAIAKTPSFSNISAVAVANFVLSHTFGQLRPHINDPIYSDDQVGINTYSTIISRSGCVDADTEFCTPTGWKRIADFSASDTVLSWGPAGYSEFVTPTHYIKQPASMLTKYSSRDFDMVLSDDHNMALLDTTGKPVKMLAGDFKKLPDRTHTIPFKFYSPTNTTGLDMTDDELRVFIVYTIDNLAVKENNARIKIRVKEPYKKERLRQLSINLTGSIVEYTVPSNPDYSIFYLPPIKGLDTNSIGLLWNLTPAQTIIAADELWRWGGALDKRGSKTFRTTKKAEADLVQFIWQSAYDTAVTMNIKDGPDNRPPHTKYKVTVTKHKYLDFRVKTDSLLTECPTVDGYQYCFTMPNSNWVARREGKIFLTHNSGKDSTYQAITKTTLPALDYINNLAAIEAEEVARAKYIKEAAKTIKGFDESSVCKDDYEEHIKKPEILIASLGSSRGGLTTSLNRMAHTNFHTKSLFASELGLAIQSNAGIIPVLELFSTLYDMGQSVAPEFKTEDAKEESVEGMYPNLLGISSPTPFYQEGNVRKLFIPMLTTSLARRMTIVFSTAKEEFENMYIPQSPAEKRQLQAEQRVLLSTYTDSISKQLLTAVKSLSHNSTIMFDEESSVIYDDYKAYTQELSKSLLLCDKESVEGIEMSGRAFKMGRIAATWAIASNSNVISADVLKAAIYFCDYTAQHLIKFVATLNLKDYELFIADWEQEFFGNILPIDKAITKGYINVKAITQQSLNNFLKPVNSKLEGVATVSYDEVTNAFVFVPVVRNLDNTYSYRACQGHTTTAQITNIVTGKTIDALGSLLTVDSSFNPFVEDTAKFIVLRVSNAFLTAQMVSKYIANICHFIAPTSDDHSFTILIPTNMVIERSQYKYIVLSIAHQLMLKIAPELCESTTVHHGYAGIPLLASTAEAPLLYDISGIIGSFAAGTPAPLLAVKPNVKPTSAVVAKYLQTDIIDNQAIIVDMLNVSNNPTLLLANIVYDMRIHGVDQHRCVSVINSINSALDTSMPESTIHGYFIEPFIGLI